ncbi:hypothetical protein PRIPAC_95639 [Pristionchus pacificus]|uniref:Uncharacterized protein n=1 Tax=Pristionchus pacificus TaxID=54126 RepID=A0A2A6BC69_PRIPA|nr:hypothetical protein PRIPAC_95639 [Pristionchus pacificus]|eukprot:PDM63483.1 hypothetical protein PRIPAC_53840 [Pristionchus pacificus]
MSDSRKRSTNSKASSGPSLHSHDDRSDTSEYGQSWADFFRDFEAQLQPAEYKKPSSRYLAHLYSTLEQGTKTIEVLEELLKCKRAYRDHLRNGGDVLRGLSPSALNVHPMKNMVIQMCKMSQSSRGEQMRFVNEFKEFKRIQKAEPHLVLKEEQMRKTKKIDTLRKIVNYNVDELEKTDGEIREREQER